MLSHFTSFLARVNTYTHTPRVRRAVGLHTHRTSPTQPRRARISPPFLPIPFFLSRSLILSCIMSDKLLDQIFNLKFTSKQMVRQSIRAEKDEKEEKLKVRASGAARERRERVAFAGRVSVWVSICRVRQGGMWLAPPMAGEEGFAGASWRSRRLAGVRARSGFLRARATTTTTTTKKKKKKNARHHHPLVTHISSSLSPSSGQEGH